VPRRRVVEITPGLREVAGASFVLLVALWLAPASARADAGSEAFARGLEYFKRERYAEARREFTDATSAQPASAEAHFYLGLTSSRLEDYASAVAAIQKAIELDPALPGGHMSLGIAHYEQGDYAAAAEELERELANDAENASAQLFLGLSYQKLGRYDDSIARFERAAAQDPSFEQLALYNIGLSQLEMRQYQPARESLQRAIAVDPESDSADSARTLLRVVDSEEKDQKPYSLNGKIGLEVASNVTVPELDASSGKSDVAGIFELGGAFRFLDAPNYEAEVGYDFYQSVYSDVTRANLQSHTFGIDGTREVYGADVGGSYRFTYSRLGGDDFLNLHNLLPSVGFSVLPNWYAIVGYNYQHKDFDEDNDRDGDQHALALDNFWFLCDGSASLSLGYRLQQEDTHGAEYDYFGNLVNARFKTPLSIKSFEFDGVLFFQYQSRDYDNITVSIGKKRNDNRYNAALGLGKDLNEFVRAQIDYQYFNSDSNLPDADYDEHIVTVSIGIDY
jgi:tetratricopeptide (TPR) repeat protein